MINGCDFSNYKKLSRKCRKCTNADYCRKCTNEHFATSQQEHITNAGYGINFDEAVRNIELFSKLMRESAIDVQTLSEVKME